MDPKHIIRALAALYVEEHGGLILISKEAVTDAFHKELVVDVLPRLVVGSQVTQQVLARIKA